MSKSYGIEVKYRDFHVESKEFETEDQLAKYIADINWASVVFTKVERLFVPGARRSA